MDMAMSSSGIPPTLGYADINADLDTKTPGLGCTLPSGGCHGGTNPTGKMALLDGAAGDMAKLMANYAEVVQRVDKTTPANSLLLTKPLNSTVPHQGGTFFQSTNTPMYRRWLVWIQLGAPFDPVSTAGNGGG
jgi:hypothetical protein